MPRIKKTTVTEQAEIHPLVPQEATSSTITSAATAENKDIVKKEKNKQKETNDISPDMQAPVVEILKEKFKQLHIKDTYWLENDIYQTITDITEGKKGAKALIINQALKDYLKKNKLEIKPLRAKGKKS